MSEGIGDIKRVRNTFELEEVNKALENGWKLLSVAAGQDETSFPITKYTLGSRLTEDEAKALKAARK